MTISCSRSCYIFSSNFSIKKFFTLAHSPHKIRTIAIECGALFFLSLAFRNVAFPLRCNHSSIRIEDFFCCCSRTAQFVWIITENETVCILFLYDTIVFDLVGSFARSLDFCRSVWQQVSLSSLSSSFHMLTETGEWQWQQRTTYLQRFCGLLRRSITTILKQSEHFVDIGFFSSTQEYTIGFLFNNTDIYLSPWLDLQQPQ